jgi:hypothetical protein
MSAWVRILLLGFLATLGAAAGSLPRSAQGCGIDGPALTSINVPGEPEAVTTHTLAAVDLVKPVRLPAHSITVLKGESHR